MQIRRKRKSRFLEFPGTSCWMPNVLIIIKTGFVCLFVFTVTIRAFLVKSDNFLKFHFSRWMHIFCVPLISNLLGTLEGVVVTRNVRHDRTLIRLWGVDHICLHFIQVNL